MPGIIRTPIALTITSRIVRFSPQTTPFQIINTDLNATVWVANNPSITPGNGTPASSGTALPWTSNGDIYLILGVDALSVAAASAQIIISYDVSNWYPSPAAIAAAVLNSGVLIVDQPAQLVATTVTNNTTANTDVSRYSSVLCEILAVTAPTKVTLGFQSLINGVVQTHFGYEMNFYQAGGTNWTGSLPIKGNILSVTVLGSANLNIVGSYRQQATVENGWNRTFVTSNLLLNNSQVIAGGGTFGTNLFSAPYFGMVQITMQSTGGVANQLVISEDGGATTYLYNTIVQLAGNADNISILYPCWGKQLQFFAINRAAGNQTFNLQVHPYQPR